LEVNGTSTYGSVKAGVILIWLKRIMLLFLKKSSIPWQRRNATRNNNKSLIINPKLAQYVSGNTFALHQEY
jgi:hypothetical protein